MTVLLEQVVNGLTLGSLYGLVALGLALLLGVVRFANFAHGEFLMLSAYVLVGLRAGLGLPYGVAAPLAVLAMAVRGLPLRADRRHHALEPLLAVPAASAPSP